VPNADSLAIQRLYICSALRSFLERSDLIGRFPSIVLGVRSLSASCVPEHLHLEQARGEICLACSSYSNSLAQVRQRLTDHIANKYTEYRIRIYPDSRNPGAKLSRPPPDNSLPLQISEDRTNNHCFVGQLLDVCPFLPTLTLRTPGVQRSMNAMNGLMSMYSPQGRAKNAAI
jgi:hypothetical protein